MPAAQLKETTMNPRSRVLLRMTLPDAMTALRLSAEETGAAEDLSNPSADVDDLVQRLMGRDADARYRFIQDNAQFVEDIDV